MQERDASILQVGEHAHVVDVVLRVQVGVADLLEVHMALGLGLCGAMPGVELCHVLFVLSCVSLGG